MSPQLLDRYIDDAGPLHALDARVKLLLALGQIVVAALLPPGSWLALAGLTALVWSATIVAGVGLPVILRRALVALPFALVAITLVFSLPGRPVFQIPLGFATLTATDAGLIRFVSIVWKSWISVQAALLLMATTHMLDVLRALRSLRLPAIIVTILSFTYRYLFVLVDEAQRLMRARECRSAALDGRGGRSVWWRAQVTGRMAGTLLLRAFERSERIYVAMLSRGYTGDLRSLSAPAMSRRDWLWGGFGTLLLLLIAAQALLG
jgi:cobalt/nickel transport system permease protein